MPVIEEDWSSIWQSLGYNSEHAMLADLYIENNLSLSEIAGVIGYSAVAIRRRLIQHSIPLRNRGGTNNLGKRKLRDVPDWVLNEPTDKVARALNVHPSTIYAERRLREFSSNHPKTIDGVGDAQEQIDTHGISSTGFERQPISRLVSTEKEGGEEGNT